MKTIAVWAFLASTTATSVAAETNPATNLVPADGAQNVTLSPSLSWTWEPQMGCPEGIGIVVFTVTLGTDPQSLSPAGLCCNEGWPQPVGPLEPGTQYFWQVKVVDEFRDCSGSHEALSAVQSFTTAGTVSARPPTWETVKRLYR